MVIPAPLEHQVPILSDYHRFKIIVAGRRFGKTMLGLMAVLGGHGPDRKFLGALQGGNVWWVAPNYGMASDIWYKLKQSLMGIQDMEGFEKREDERIIRLPGGGAVTVKSADNPDSLRGLGLDGICFDEAAYMDEETWTMALRPALADRQGWAIFISTPKMDDVDKKKGIEWFKRLYLDADCNPDWGRWQRPSMDNKTIPAAEFEVLKRTMPDLAYRQEILAEFVDIGEGLFKPEQIRYYWRDGESYYLVTQDGLLTIPAGNCKVVITADLASKKGEMNDFTAVTVWAFTPTFKMMLLDVIRGKYTDNQMKNMFWQAWNQWHPLYIAIEDKMSGQTYIQALRDGTVIKDDATGRITNIPPMRIVPLLTKNEDKATRAINLAEAYKAGRVFHPDKAKMHAPWLKEFERELMSFPSKQVHDDQVDAAAYASIELSKPGLIDTANLPFLVLGGR